MKTKSAKQPKRNKPVVGVKDLQPRKNPKAGTSRTDSAYASALVVDPSNPNAGARISKVVIDNNSP